MSRTVRLFTTLRTSTEGTRFVALRSGTWAEVTEYLRKVCAWDQSMITDLYVQRGDKIVPLFS